MKNTYIGILSIILIFLSGCAPKEKYQIAKNPLEASYLASYELSYMKRDYERYLIEIISDKLQNIYMPGSKNVLTDKIVAVTDMVNVNDFNQTSNFGRLFTDLMITDLERSGWNVADIRGTHLSVNEKEGLFYLSRKDIKNLPSNSLLLTGTYSEYADNLILNIRLIDPQYNTLLSSTNILLEDKVSLELSRYSHCNSLECKKEKKKSTKKIDTYTVKIVEDNCLDTKICKDNK